MPLAHNLHARGKENCPPGCGGDSAGGNYGCKKACPRTNTIKEDKARSVYEADPDLYSAPQESLQGTRYVARIEYLEHIGMCVARMDMRKINGHPRCVECVICGVVLDLGPINLGIHVFRDHFVKFHVPQDLYDFFESHSDNDTEGDEDSLDEECSYDGDEEDFTDNEYESDDEDRDD